MKRRAQIDLSFAENDVKIPIDHVNRKQSETSNEILIVEDGYQF